MFLDAGCQLNLDVSQSGDNILHYLVSHARTRKVEPMLQAIMNAVSTIHIYLDVNKYAYFCYIPILMIKNYKIIPVLKCI